MKYFASSLLPRNKWFKKMENLKAGDLVLELSPGHKRSQLEMALVVITYPSKDGLTRKVRIETQKGQANSQTVRHSYKGGAEWGRSIRTITRATH